MFNFHPQLLLRNAKAYNSFFKTFELSDVWISEGRFLHIAPAGTCELEADCEVDAEGRWLVPGLIDIHMHVESSMLTPSRFGQILATYGVTTIVTEPHEMANVCGTQGILDMIEDGKNCPIDIFYAVPSCVPATDSSLETTGGILTSRDMEALLKYPQVLCVGEVMNYRQIIRENRLEIGKLLAKLRGEESRIPIEGHCPSLVGLDLSKFLYTGINSDHTEHDWEELRQRFAGGMFIELQEKMLSAEILDKIRENHLEEHFCFVTDDVMVDTLVEKGHLNWVLRKAMELGFPPEQALYNASYTPARRMNLRDRGALAPGLLADFSLLDDLRSWDVSCVYKRGNIIYSRDATQNAPVQAPGFAPFYSKSIHLDQLDDRSFEVQAPVQEGQVTVRVMEVRDGSTKTREVHESLPVHNGLLDWENQGVLLTLVFERYGKSGEIGRGFVKGDCHKHGAIASSFSHDNHNVIVAGSNVRDMNIAVRRLLELQGGMVVVDAGEVLAEIQLKIGGILSDKDAASLAVEMKNVRQAMQEIGYRHYNPIMSFATLSLPVSPALKLTDKGLIDVPGSKIVSLFPGETEA